MYLKLSIIALTVFATVNSAPYEAQTFSYNSDWWKHGVFYQVYPRSFKDSNNDGLGDLQGIISKLDHFRDAGITGIWLSPIFKSPQVDMGYDISDYRMVDPVYGTNDDLIELIDKAHELGIKVILDFVPNHTSDQHEWFINSENGVEEYKDFYVWTDGILLENGTRIKPNNWVSIFRNSTWTWSEKRQQFYLHQFQPAQPDLNFRNPAVREALKDVLRFWLDHNVDGFRIDAMPFLVEDDQLRDEPLSGNTDENDYSYLVHIYTFDQPLTYEVLYEWRQVVDQYSQEHGGPDRILMAEAYTTMENTMLYYGSADGSQLGAHFSFNFNLITDVNSNSKAQDFVNAILRWLNVIPDGYISNWVLGNHDQHRVATRFGPDNVDGFNMLMAMLPGIGVTYNGEEIGQENGEVTFEQGQDPAAFDPATFNQISRDFERCPFQWDNSTNAGFNDGAKPWLPVSEKYLQNNLQAQMDAFPSHYKIYQELLKLRQTNVALNGDVNIKAIGDKVIVLSRKWNNESLAVIFNIGDNEENVNVEDVVTNINLVHLASVNSEKDLTVLDPSDVNLDPHEGLVVLSV